MPVGVQVVSAVRSGPSGSVTAESGRYFVTAVTERGRADEAVEIRSYAQLTDEYGPATAYATAHDNLSTFFAEGGGVAYVARVVGPTATVGTVNLMDGAATPAAAVRIDASGAGAWSNRLDVTVTVPTAGLLTVAVTLDDVEVERYTSVTSNVDLAGRLRTSRYVRATALTATMPAAQTVAVSAGADDRAAVTGANHVTALTLFDDAFGDGAVACPGQPSSAVGVGIVAHCVTHNRIGLLSPANGAALAQAVTAAAALSSEYAGMFWPWVLIADGVGGSRAVSPEGYVAAVRARAHTEVGPARPPAGEISTARTLIGTVTAVDETAGNQADAARVSAIRIIARRPRLYGWRSLSTDDANWSLLSHRDTMNRLTVDAETRLEQFVGRPITSLELGRVAAELKAMIQPFVVTDQLYPLYDDAGEQIDPGYLIEAGPSVNTAAVSATNTIRADLYVRIAPAGTLIQLRIVKVAVTATLL